MMLASGRNGMAASPHPLATEAGLSVLKAGGNAIEAAIAIGATIGVVCPHFCGLGGDGVWLVADRRGRRDCFLGIGQAAARLPDFQTNIPVRGPLSMLTSACAVDAWRHAHKYSTRHWRGGTAVVCAARGRHPARARRLPGHAITKLLARFPPERSGKLARLRGPLHAERRGAGGRKSLPSGTAWRNLWN